VEASQLAQGANQGAIAELRREMIEVRNAQAANNGEITSSLNQAVEASQLAQGANQGAIAELRREFYASQQSGSVTLRRVLETFQVCLTTTSDLLLKPEEADIGELCKSFASMRLTLMKFDEFSRCVRLSRCMCFTNSTNLEINSYSMSDFLIFQMPYLLKNVFN